MINVLGDVTFLSFVVVLKELSLWIFQKPHAFEPNGYFVTPSDVVTGDDDPEATSSSQINSSAPSNGIHRSPSHWQLIREHVLVENNVPPSPPQPSVLGDDEAEGNYSPTYSPTSTRAESPTVSKNQNNQGNSFRTLRTKAIAQQRLDVHKLEKEIEKLFFKKYSNNAFTGANGSLANNSLSSISTTENVNIWSEILNLLKQWKHVVKLPASSLIFAELSKAFFNYPVNVDDCNKSIDIFEYIMTAYKPVDKNENFSRIQWCCKLLETRHNAIRNRVFELVEKHLNYTAENSNFPTSITTIHTLIYTFVHTLVVISVGSEITEDVAKLNKKLNGFLERLAAGTLVSIDDEMSIPNSKVQIHKYDTLARCIFLEGLIKCLLVKDVQLRKYKYWVIPDTTMNDLHEHVIKIFAQAVFEILCDPKSLLIDSENPYVSLPHIILRIMNQTLPAKNLRRISPPVVRSLVNVVVSIFTLPWPEPIRNSLFTPSTTPKNRRTPSSSGGVSINQQSDNEFDISPEVDQLSENISRGRKFTSDGMLMPEMSKQPDNHVLISAKSYIEALWNEGWKNEIIELVKEASDDFGKIITIFDQLVFGINDTIGSEIVAETISDLFDKIVSLKPEPSPLLKKLLLMLSSNYRPQFYKQMLACVASDSEQKVVEYLYLIFILRNYMSGIELFMQD
ncbi:2454_t:CDS:2, partial [Gigaspora rosea]